MTLKNLWSSFLKTIGITIVTIVLLCSSHKKTHYLNVREIHEWTTQRQYRDTLKTFGTQETGRRQTTQKRKTQKIRRINQNELCIHGHSMV